MKCSMVDAVSEAAVERIKLLEPKESTQSKPVIEKVQLPQEEESRNRSKLDYLKSMYGEQEVH